MIVVEMKERLGLFGYHFQPDSRIDTALIGGIYSVGAGLVLEAVARGAVDLKKTIDTKFRGIPEEQAKENAQKIKKKLVFIRYGALAAGMALGSIYPQKTYEIGLNMEKRIHHAIYSVGHQISKITHGENKK